MRKPQTLKALLGSHLIGLLRAYATIVFLDRAVAGFVILLVTLLFPALGLSGALAALVGLLTAALLRFPQISSGIHIYNSLLVGLSLGAFYQLSLQLLLLVVIGAVLAVFFTAIFARILWSQDRLPILSLPFVVVALMLAFAARRFDNLLYGLATPLVALDWFSLHWLGEEAGKFFASLGAIFFMSYPLIGFIVFIIIFLHSRYLALLAVSGYVLAYAFLHLLVGELPMYEIIWSGFNFSLTSMAIGGFFTIPSLSSFLLAMLAAAICAVLTAALQALLSAYGLPVLAVPFVVTALTVLAALRQRLGIFPPFVAPTPDLPEKNYERARLARVRMGEIGNIVLLPPFMGEWDVYQGFKGEHTHRGAWQHALDFYICEDGKSFANQAKTLDDFHCFGLPVLSPVFGTVLRCEGQFPDNLPGEMDTRNNWGNFVLIGLDSGDYVLLAHLRQNSIKVKEKQRVEPGVVLAACGNSGRSPQPHIHLQVQEHAELGSPTKPFQLASVVTQTQEDGSFAPPHYRLLCLPNSGDRLAAAKSDENLAANLHLPVGRCLEYSVDLNGKQAAIKRRFMVEVSLAGEYRFVSDSGASAAFTESNGVLGFYDRLGPRDVVLDAWLLAMGLTPLTDSAQRWRDEPSAKLFPLSVLSALMRSIRYPMGAGLQSDYQRHWHVEEAQWIQAASHSFVILASKEARSKAYLNASAGCVRFTLEAPTLHLDAQLTSIGLIADEGIPGWTEAIAQASMHEN